MTRERVAVDIAIDPVAWRLQAGQTLRLRIAGRDLVPKALPGVVPAPTRGACRSSCGAATVIRAVCSYPSFPS